MLQQRCHSRVVQLYSRRFSFLNILRNFWFSESLSYFSAFRLSHNLRWTKQTGLVKKLTVEILTKEFIYFYTHIWFNFSRRKTKWQKTKQQAQRGSVTFSVTKALKFEVHGLWLDSETMDDSTKQTSNHDNNSSLQVKGTRKNGGLGPSCSKPD